MEENMKSKKILLAIVVLVTVTAVLAVIHLNNSPTVNTGELLILQGSKESSVTIDQQLLVPVTGTLVNGKGEQIPVDAMGLALADVLQLAGVEVISGITVTARDEYHAEVTAEELSAEGKVYLTIDADGTFRLVIFGDSNSKRNVSDVIKLIIS